MYFWKFFADLDVVSLAPSFCILSKIVIATSWVFIFCSGVSFTRAKVMMHPPLQAINHFLQKSTWKHFKKQIVFSESAQSSNKVKSSYTLKHCPVLHRTGSKIFYNYFLLKNTLCFLEKKQVVMKFAVSVICRQQSRTAWWWARQ